MSRISLVVGLPDASSTAKPELVYLGRSGAEMRAAEQASPFPRHLVCAHVGGIPKNNPHAAANAARLSAKKSAKS